MSTELTWLGHGTWSIRTAGQTILLDPFLDDSPTAPLKSEEVKADYILVSHGHGDHVSDAAKIARRTGATVISNYEICTWLSAQGVERTVGHNLGGGSQHSFGRVKLTLAHHSSSLPDGSNGGNPSGFLLTLADGTIYFACDTALFYDMKLIGAAGIDLAVLPIGDRGDQADRPASRRPFALRHLAAHRPGRAGLGQARAGRDESRALRRRARREDRTELRV